MHGQSDSSEQTTSNEVPVLEEFIPMKRSSASSDDDEEEHSHQPTTEKISNDNKKKSDWLRSVQLWNSPSDPPLKEVTQE